MSALKINFDTSGNPELSTFILAHKDGSIIGELGNVSDVKVHGAMKDAFEISFVFHKYDGTIESPYWEYLIDFRLVYCKEWDTWFEAIVEINQDDETSKSVSLKRLGEAELSQIRVYDMEINTELDISRDDYINPTILYKPGNPEESLVHRILKDKAPHYSIRHVDESIRGIQRTFTFNDKAITECFAEIADEIDALVVYDSDSNDMNENRITVNRTISIYDMLAHCKKCNYRGEFTYTCPKCGNSNIDEGYGHDTTICIDSECLGNEMTISVDTDAVKNCYRLQGGDDLMTAAMKSCNPNGSNYIWFVSYEEQKDMSQKLVDRLASYGADYDYYQKEYSPTLTTSIVSAYNTLVEKYLPFNENLERLNTLTGYPKIVEAMWKAIDFKLFLEYALMPTPTTSGTTAAEQAALLTTSSLSPIAVTSANAMTISNTNNSVLSFAKLLIDKRYQVKLRESGLDGTHWQGIFIVTNRSDSEDKAETDPINVTITTNYEMYIKQRLRKRLENTTYSGSISALYDLTLADFKQELKKYGVSSLSIFNDAGQACIEILDEQGITEGRTWGTDPNLYERLYVPYYQKVKSVQEELAIRDKEVNSVQDIYNQLEIVRNNIQSALDFETYLGTELWKDFSAYRREETYSNENCISDGLNNAEMFQRAFEVVQEAVEDIQKVSGHRHQISTTMKNLLVIKEFESLKQYFEVGNWIRVKDNDGNIYKLRMLDYDIDFDDLTEINVTFSDAIKIVDRSTEIKDTIVKTSSIIKNYNTTINNALGRYEILNDRLNETQNHITINNNTSSDNTANKVDKENVIGSINGSTENGVIDINKLNKAELLKYVFDNIFIVSDKDISVGDPLEDRHIYIYYGDGGTSGGGDTGGGDTSGGDTGGGNDDGNTGGGNTGTLADGVLYDNGVTSDEVGSWTIIQNVSSMTDHIAIEDSDYLYSYAPDGKNSIVLFSGDNKLDYSAYNTLNIEYDLLSYDDSIPVAHCGFHKTANQTSSSGIAGIKMTKTSDIEQTHSITSQTFNGSLCEDYPYLYIKHSNNYKDSTLIVYKIWLSNGESSDGDSSEDDDTNSDTDTTISAPLDGVLYDNGTTAFEIGEWLFTQNDGVYPVTDAVAGEDSSKLYFYKPDSTSYIHFVLQSSNKMDYSNFTTLNMEYSYYSDTGLNEENDLIYFGLLGETSSSMVISTKLPITTTEWNVDTYETGSVNITGRNDNMVGLWLNVGGSGRAILQITRIWLE